MLLQSLLILIWVKQFVLRLDSNPGRFQDHSANQLEVSPFQISVHIRQFGRNHQTLVVGAAALRGHLQLAQRGRVGAADQRILQPRLFGRWAAIALSKNYLKAYWDKWSLVSLNQPNLISVKVENFSWFYNNEEKGIPAKKSVLDKLMQTTSLATASENLVRDVKWPRP